MSAVSRAGESVQFPREVTLSSICEIHDDVTAAFARDGAIEFDIRNVEIVDLGFVQLVEAARKAAAADGRQIGLSHPASQPVAQLLQRAGFLESATPADIDFWFHGDATQ